MVRSIVSRFSAVLLSGAVVVAGTLLIPTVSHADPRDHHGRGEGWHDEGERGDGWRGGWHGDRGWRGPSVIFGPRFLPPPPVYYAPPPVYYAPPPVYYAPRTPAYYGPPPVVYAPPPIYAAPGLSLGINIPLR